MIKVLPEFWDQFGDIGYLEPSGGIVYAPNKIKETYHFPEHMSEAENVPLKKIKTSSSTW